MQSSPATIWSTGVYASPSDDGRHHTCSSRVQLHVTAGPPGSQTARVEAATRSGSSTSSLPAHQAHSSTPHHPTVSQTINTSAQSTTTAYLQQHPPHPPCPQRQPPQPAWPKVDTYSLANTVTGAAQHSSIWRSAKSRSLPTSPQKRLHSPEVPLGYKKPRFHALEENRNISGSSFVATSAPSSPDSRFAPAKSHNQRPYDEGVFAGYQSPVAAHSRPCATTPPEFTHSMQPIVHSPSDRLQIPVLCRTFAATSVSKQKHLDCDINLNAAPAEPALLSSRTGAEVGSDTEFCSSPQQPPKRKAKPLRLHLAEWGLPFAVQQAFQATGVTKMYPWQSAALECGEDGSNLVYCAPTSGGKSLVAEVLMIRRLLAARQVGKDRHGTQTEGHALLVLPYVSLVAEKTAHLQQILQAAGYQVKGYYGGEHVAVCTIEKANVTINRLIKDGRLGDLCCLVVDELHMVCDPQRGPALELSISKLLYSEHAPNIQVIGMSATMGGLEVLGDWLKARLFLTNFRPVPLTEHVVFLGKVYRKECVHGAESDPMRPIRELPESAARDKDRLLPLIAEVVAEGHSVLVFCAGRKQCQSCADMVADLLPEVLRAAAGAAAAGGTAATRLQEQRRALVAEMQDALAGYSNKTLESTMAAGVAYHHAGLTDQERCCIEKGFRSGVLNVLMATSTLAAGINLPARRVILRSLWQGIGPVSRAQYLQMVGRAGRAGQCTSGEAFLIGQGAPWSPVGEWRPVVSLLTAPLPSVRSGLLASTIKQDELAAAVAPSDLEHLKRLLLEAVSNGSVCTGHDVHHLVCSTLLSRQVDYQLLHRATMAALQLLRDQKLLMLPPPANGEPAAWQCTPMGKAVYDSCLPAEAGMQLYQQLAAARGRSFLLGDHLHLIYTILPAGNPFQIYDWRQWDTRFQRLPERHRALAEDLGILQTHISQRSSGKPMHSSDAEEVAQKHSDFVAACALNALLYEGSAWDVADKWGTPNTITRTGVSRGQLQKLQVDLAKQAAMAQALCHSAGWGDMEILVGLLAQQAATGARTELLHLMKMPGMTAAKARAVYNAGFKDPEAMLVASSAAVEAALVSALPRTMQRQGAPGKGQAKPKGAAAFQVGLTGDRSTNALLTRMAATLIAGARQYVVQLAEASAEEAQHGTNSSCHMLDADDALDSASSNASTPAAQHIW